MAILHSIGSGNFTAAATWGVVNNNGAGSTASFLDASTATASITTTLSTSASQSFQTGANITVSGVAVKITSRVASPTGTLTVELYNATSSSSVAQVIINVSDLPNTAGSSSMGWAYFKFAANQNLTSGTNYQIRMATSSTNQVGAFIDTVATNWGRALVTTTTSAPASLDTLLINGVYNSAGSNATYTVTMDSTSVATAYGLTYIGNLGLLNFPTTSGTQQIRFANNVTILKGGTLQMGTSGTPIPSTSTAILEISGSTPGQYNLIIYGGTLTTYGNAITTKAKLAADVAAAATSSTTNVSTGWLSGDIIAVASTTRTSTQAELITLSSNAVGTTLSHGSYTNAHGGNSGTLVQADMGNLTRNVKIQSTSNTNTMSIRSYGHTPTISCYYTNFLNLGNASSAGFLFYNLVTVSPTFDMSFCSIYTNNAIANTIAISIGLNMSLATSINFSNNIVYGYSSNGMSFTYAGQYSNTNNPTINDNIFIRNGSPGIVTNFYSGTFSGNSITSNSSVGWQSNVSVGTVYGTWTINSNNIYSNGGIGFQYLYSYPLSTQLNIDINNLTSWRNNSNGVTLQNVNVGVVNSYLKFTNLYTFGNNGSGLALDGQVMGRVLIDSSYFWGGATLVQNYGIQSANDQNKVDSLYISNTQFGKDYTGGTSNFGLSVINNAFSRGYNMVMYNCNFNSSTETSNNTTYLPVYYVAVPISINHNQTYGINKSWTNAGTRLTDTVIFNTASPSLKLSPSSTTFKLESPMVRIPVNSGGTCNVSVKVRKSISTDAGGANYNGNQPRLMFRYNFFNSVTGDTVGATMTAALGNWETLTYTTPAFTTDCVAEFFVDCDGNVGWVNVDDWSTTTTNDSRGTKYWAPSVINYVEPDYSSGGGSSEKSFTFFG